MPTVIDALVVTLGLDGAKFKSGADQVAGGQKKIAASTVAMGKDVDAVTRGMVAGITKVRNELLALLALFTAGRGIKNLTGDMIEADAAIGRTAKNLGLATEELSTLSHAGERSGGTFAGATASIGGFIGKLEQFKINGQGANDILEGLAQTGVSLRNQAGGWKSMTEVFADLNAWAQNTPRPRANQILIGMGLDEGTRNLILSTQAEFNEKVRKARVLGNADGAWADIAGKIETSMSEMGQRFTTAWRTIVSAVGPTILRILEKIGAWIDKYGPAWEASIGKAITETLESFETWVGSIDQAKWDGFFKTITDGLKEFRDILKAIYNWEPPAWIRQMLGLSAHPFQLGGGGSQAAAPAGDPQGEVMFTVPGLGWKIRRRVPEGQGAPAPAAASGERGFFGRMWDRAMGRDAGGAGASVPSGGAFNEKAPGVTAKLMADFGLTRDQAASIVGNLGHESGLQAVNERNPTVPGSRGGFGWAQWTGPRRVAFEQWAATNKLDVNSDEANYGFLKHELNGPEKASLDALRGTKGLEEGTRVFQEKFERAGVVALDRRIALANRAAAGTSDVGASELARVLSDFRKQQAQVSAGATAQMSALPMTPSSFQSGGTYSTAATSNDNSVSNQTNIHGPINIQTAAVDAKGIAGAIGGHLGSYQAYRQENRVG